MDFDRLDNLMSAIGFVEVKRRWKASGKMAYWMYAKGGGAILATEAFKKKTVLKTGNRNNFSILL